MRIVATIHVTDVKVCVHELKPITAGTVGSGVHFEFDGDWNTLKKKVVFEGAVKKEVKDAGADVEIPAFVLAAANVALRVGVTGIGADEQEVLPTLWADLGTVRASPEGDKYPPPDQNTYTLLEQLQEDVQLLEDKVNSMGDGSGGSISAKADGDTIIITTSLTVRADGDAIIIGGA